MVLEPFLRPLQNASEYICPSGQIPTLLFNVLEFVILHNSGKIALANKATEALNGPRVQQKNQNENKTPNVKGNALIAVIPLQHS